jgi:hypothetical protein
MIKFFANIIYRKLKLERFPLKLYYTIGDNFDDIIGKYIDEHKKR